MVSTSFVSYTVRRLCLLKCLSLLVVREQTEKGGWSKWSLLVQLPVPSWPAAEGRWLMPWGTVFSRAILRHPWAMSGFPHDPHMEWNGLLSTWQFPLGFPEPGRSDLSSTKTKVSLAGVWKHSLLAVHFPLWATWKRFPRSAKEEPHCRADSKQPSG